MLLYRADMLGLTPTKTRDTTSATCTREQNLSLKERTEAYGELAD
jgi:hypothetical protein